MSVVAKKLQDQDMPLGTDVGLSPGHIVLDGDPAAPSPERTTEQQRPGTAAIPVTFRPMSIVAKRLDRSRCHLAWR